MTPSGSDQRPPALSGPRFAPLVAGALYPGLERGVVADAFATRALGGRALLVCTSLVVAGHGRVTDVLDVPADTVQAQVEHLFATLRPTGACVGLAGSAASASALVETLGARLEGPLVFNLTLSGPSGEDVADGRVREVLVRAFPLADVVVVGRHDAELVAGIEVATLDDAQVAVQRLHRQGARAVVLRCGSLPARDFASQSESFATDLLYDGEAFTLYEAPVIERPDLEGASSAFVLALLKARLGGLSLEESVRLAKHFVTEAL
ncbi:MAG TPA: PfkB family carbohydrate kinase, partial [Rhodothermales bacterium]|nr:PfkB family carbohydrate kinase [Rhodothermales bacterium]